MRLIHRNGNIHEDEELFLDDRFTLSEAKQNRREAEVRGSGDPVTQFRRLYNGREREDR